MQYLLLIKTRKHAGVSQSRQWAEHSHLQVTERIQELMKTLYSLFRGIVRRAAQTNLLSLIFQIAVVFILHFSAGLWFLRAFWFIASSLHWDSTESLFFFESRHCISEPTDERQLQCANTFSLTLGSPGQPVDFHLFQSLDADPVVELWHCSDIHVFPLDISWVEIWHDHRRWAKLLIQLLSSVSSFVARFWWIIWE